MSAQYPLPLPHREAMEADDFMVASSNQEAIAWLDKFPAWPSHCMIVYGPTGSGKTHLANVWRARSGGTPLTPPELIAQSATALSEGGSKIMIDGADQIAGDAKAEEALFHLFNALRDAKGFLLLTGSKPPAQWNIQLPDLRSRLLAATAVAITAPDDDLLSALFVKQFRDRQIDVSMDVVDYLLPRVTRTPGSIRDIVTALDRASLSEGRGITVALARKLLQDQSFPQAQ
ncbi:MAG TPA: DnaA/Hda family protein [Alphaproteobacteria bacterium]|nr:DnaA/Hda family protein [Alphaproteobacteria bacterium]